MNRNFEDLKKDSGFKKYIKNLFLEKAVDFRKQNILELELTNRCSIGCFYCGASIDSNPVFLAFDTVCSSITQFADSRTSRSIDPHFSLTGGDPLEYPHFEELLAFLKHQKIRFSLKLNPSTLNAAMVEKIGRAGCETVKLTFMGKKSQSKYRKKDTLEKLCGATRLFEACKIPVVWHLSLGEFNREDLLDSLDFILENRPNAVSLGRLARVGRLNQGNYPVDMPAADFREFLKQVLLFFYNHKRDGFNLVFKEKLWVPFLCEEGVLSEEDLLISGIRLGCDAGERLLVLTYAGDLIGCGLLPQPVLSRTDDPDFVDKIRSIPAECGFSVNNPCDPCKFIEVCRGCRGVAGGTAGGKDPQCWRWPISIRAASPT